MTQARSRIDTFKTPVRCAESQFSSERPGMLFNSSILSRGLTAAGCVPKHRAARRDAIFTRGKENLFDIYIVSTWPDEQQSGDMSLRETSVSDTNDANHEAETRRSCTGSSPLENRTRPGQANDLRLVTTNKREQVFKPAPAMPEKSSSARRLRGVGRALGWRASASAPARHARIGPHSAGAQCERRPVTAALCSRAGLPRAR
jgi:hypothetical protein